MIPKTARKRFVSKVLVKDTSGKTFPKMMKTRPKSVRNSTIKMPMGEYNSKYKNLIVSLENLQYNNEGIFRLDCDTLIAIFTQSHTPSFRL